MSSALSVFRTAVDTTQGNTLVERWGPLLVVIVYLAALLLILIAGLGLFGKDTQGAASTPAVTGVIGVLGPIAGFYLHHSGS